MTTFRKKAADEGRDVADIATDFVAHNRLNKLLIRQQNLVMLWLHERCLDDTKIASNHADHRMWNQFWAFNPFYVWQSRCNACKDRYLRLVADKDSDDDDSDRASDDSDDPDLPPKPRHIDLFAKHEQKARLKTGERQESWFKNVWEACIPRDHQRQLNRSWMRMNAGDYFLQSKADPVCGVERINDIHLRRAWTFYDQLEAFSAPTWAIHESNRNRLNDYIKYCKERQGYAFVSQIVADRPQVQLMLEFLYADHFAQMATMANECRESVISNSLVPPLLRIVVEYAEELMCFDADLAWLGKRMDAQTRKLWQKIVDRDGGAFTPEAVDG